MPSEEIIAMPNLLITYHEGGMEVESSVIRRLFGTIPAGAGPAASRLTAPAI
jgi:hypothetical protein